ncbi:MAG TPA: hypothetical protein VFH39_01140 [Candidatus Saccharimonadales bacterium]|nr:hypothetical protein [Candidatus Saccharimonadales bacterium]
MGRFEVQEDAMLGLETIKHPGRIATASLAALAMTGGAFAACGASETVAHAGHASLESVTLEKGTYCDASFVADIQDVEASFTKDLPGPFNYGRSVHLSERLQATICVKAESIDAKYDSKVGKYVVNLVASPDPNKSDLVLRISSADEYRQITHGGSLVQKWGNLGVDVVNSFGLNLEPNANIDDALLQVASLVADEQAAKTCEPVALPYLTKHNSVVTNENTGPNAPQTMQQDIAQNMLIRALNMDSHNHYTLNDFEVKIHAEPGGLADQYQKQYEEMLKNGPDKGLHVPDDSQLPKCTNELVKHHG